MATTNTYRIQVEDSQALAALGRIQKGVQAANTSFEGLRNVLGGIAIGAFIKNAYAMADALDDMAKASGISTAALIAFSKAVAANGGNTQDAVNGIGKFSQAIEAAAGGSREMQNRFLELGITLQDLRTLSEQDLLKKLVEGLGRGEAGSQKLAAAVAIFGKSFKSVDFAGVNADLAKFRAEAERVAPGIQAAGEASQNFQNAFGQLQIKLLEALLPISKLATKMLEFSDAIINVLKVLLALGVAIASLSVVGRVVGLIVRGFELLVASAETIQAVVLTLSTRLSSLGKYFYGVSDAVASFGVWLSNIITKFPALGQAVAGLGALLAPLIALFAGVATGVALFWDNLKKLVGIQDDANKKSEESAKQAQAEAEARRQVQSAVQNEIDALNKLIGAYQQSMAAAAQKYAADTSALSLGEDQKNLIQELQSLETNYLTEVIKLRDQLLAAQQKVANGDKVSAELIPKISDAIGTLTQAYENQINTVKELVNARNEATAALNFELFATRNLIDKENELMDIQHRMATSTMSAIEKKYADIEFAAKKAGRAAVQAEEARLKRRLRPEEARKYYDEAQKGVEELKKAHEEEYENSRRFSTGWNQAFREYAENATNAAQTAQRLFTKATQGMEDALVNFAKTGKFEWKNFLQMMLEELLRSQIRNVFANLLGGLTGSMGGSGGGVLGSLLGGLFGGGGGSGRGQSASQPMYVLDVSKGGGGAIGGAAKSAGGGIFSTITSGIGKAVSSIGSSISGAFGSIFGGAGSGQELLSGGGVNPDFMGPLSQYASGFTPQDLQDQFAYSDMFDNFSGGLEDFSSSMSDFGDSIGSFDMPSFEMPSFDMPSFDFGGWFANGGTLGAGKVGIVGERGPEMIAGPASITPLDGMGTSVTYNINAVDAASFKSMIARDPSFLYAITEQGRKSVPGAR